ncbi:MAG TPA: fumarylacetoacetate hydrolase family protein [Pyrinomonadaceae bacterium]|jgi:2-keto-4-pentenoate hydratase/2-oxohepta-3-ene-1,7-dioic acid hydratase in catechol pathway|nr:fumarylacetoacetate hydrolase family protein [Pyrinomonadaceae bacterium]
MEIISFATAESNWQRSRVGAILNHEYLLDFGAAVPGAEQMLTPLVWFDIDHSWFGRAREKWEELQIKTDLLAEAVDRGWLVKRRDAYWTAPIQRPGKLICIGLNYRDHAAESKMAIPERPVVFSKFASAVIAPGEPVVLPAESTQVDYEAELAVVIGRRAKKVKAANALDYVLGYTCFNDVSARDFQFADGQWQRGKSCDTFAPMGPTIITTDVVPDPHNLSIKFILNGQTMQDSNTDRLIFPVPELIEFLSQTITLEPGDVIATGTPAGVGFARKPPVFLQPGDKMEVVIEKVGRLNNPVTAAAEAVAISA